MEQHHLCEIKYSEIIIAEVLIVWINKHIRIELHTRTRGLFSAKYKCERRKFNWNVTIDVYKTYVGEKQEMWTNEIE